MKINFSFLIIVFVLWFFAGHECANGQNLRGKVTDLNDDPLAGAGVLIAGTYNGVQTGPDGVYGFTGLKPGSYTIRFSYIGYETVTKEVKVLRDTLIDIKLRPVTIITDDVIISATRAGDQAPFAYSNIAGDVLEKRNSGQDLPYMLSLTPSFIETSEAGNGIGYTSMRIRGTDASRINVTIDGIPLNDPESQQVFWVDLPDLASSVDNIQVQRGVGTSSNGAGAFGASINIRTRGIENEPFAEINSSAGSFGTFKNNISAGTGLLKNSFAFQMRYSDLRSKGFIERTGSEHNSAFLSALYRTGRSLLKANIILGKEHTGIGWWGVPKEMLSVNRTYNPAGEYTDENGVIQYYDNESDNYIQNHYQLIYSLKISGNLSLHSALHYTKGKGYYEEFKEDGSYAKYGLQPVTIGSTVFTETDLIRRKWMSNDFYGSVWSLNFKNKKIEATLGGELNLYSGDHFGRIIWMRNPGATERDDQWYFNNGKKGEAGIYGKMSWSLTPELSVFGDMQFRYIKYSLDGIDDDLKDIGQLHRFGFLNPKAGLFLNIASNQEAFLSFSVANREPTRSDFKEASGDYEAMPQPERLFDTELGYKVRFAKSSVALNLYGMIYKDQLVPTGELSNVGYPIMTNVERSFRTGAEITAGIIPARFFSWDFSMTLSRNKILDFTEYYFDYNTSDWSSEYKSRRLGTVDIAYSPSVIATSDLAIKLIPALKIHFISKYVGKQYFDNTMDIERMLDPYFFNNAMIEFEPETRNLRGASLQLLVNNIFNTKYENNAYGGNWFEDGTEKSWSYYFPQAGTNFILKLGLKF
ncbi:MAG TPA: TonB-dependent receptor [Bacteroidales bacterium]|nr:TonB-dependent receptor [Bacteroidales bacterium]